MASPCISTAPLASCDSWCTRDELPDRKGLSRACLSELMVIAPPAVHGLRLTQAHKLSVLKTRLCHVLDHSALSRHFAVGGEPEVVLIHRCTDFLLV